MTPRTWSRLALGGLIALVGIMVGLVVGQRVGTGHPGPDTPAVPRLDAAVPGDVTFTEQGTEEKDREFIDDFAWREFVALNWPARDGKRGVPDLKKPFGDTSGLVVWGTWKSEDDLFPKPPNTPTEWESFDAVRSIGVTEVTDVGDGRGGKRVRVRPYSVPPPPPPAGEAWKRKVLGRAIQLRTILQAGIGDDKTGALIAQNGTLVRYEVRVNRVAYEFVRSNGYYLKEKLPPEVPKSHFPDGSIHVKAAWKELKDDEPRDRYYHVRATVLVSREGEKEVWEERTMGLVGFHIVQKTPNRQDWVWATFEHVDNTEPGPGARTASFNSKNPPDKWDKATHVPPTIGDPQQPLPKPLDVSRKTALHDLTEKVNRRFHSHPQIKDTAWRHYRLVASQWPKHPGDKSTRSDRLPETDVANVTMETYKQDNSCIGCHHSSRRFNLVFYPYLRTLEQTPP